eukprot:CCRYP_020354-RA/>CCRYP_020354-RA protein AED:0.15 eAED:0.15 QI:31/1/1/1/0/0/2/205/85
MIFWVMSLFAFRTFTSPTLIWTGSDKKSNARRWISFGQVAEKSSVCLWLESGTFPMMERICGSNPMSSILSASSSFGSENVMRLL